MKIFSSILIFIFAFYPRILNKILSVARTLYYTPTFLFCFNKALKKKNCNRKIHVKSQEWKNQLYSYPSVDIVLLFLFVGVEHNQYINMVSFLLTLNMCS